MAGRFEDDSVMSSCGSADLIALTHRPLIMSGTAPPSSGSGTSASAQILIEFRCQHMLLDRLPHWLASKCCTFREENQSELSVVHYKGFAKTLDIRARPPSEDMLRILRGADVLVFDGDDFEVADSDGISVSFVCALPMVCAGGEPPHEPAPALLAFKLEDEEAMFLDSWHKLRCSIGVDKLPHKVAADLPDWLPDRVIDITYVLIPRSVCSPSYRGGILWSASAGSKLPIPRSHIFASILDDAKKISSRSSATELQQSRDHALISVQPNASPHQLLESSHEDHGSGGPGFSSGEVVLHQAALENARKIPSIALHACDYVLFAGAEETALSPSAKVFVSLGTLATLATGVVDDHLVNLKRQVVAWGGFHIVACELAAESALYEPSFPETLPWQYFHAQRSKYFGDRVELQEGLLHGVRYSGLHCH